MELHHTMLAQNEDLRERMEKIELTVNESQDKVLTIIQPIAEEIVRVSELSNRLESNTLTRDQFDIGIKAVTAKLDVLEEQIDIIYEYHRKENSMRKKIGDNLKGKLDDVDIDHDMRETGIHDELSSYSINPSKFKLHSIISKIKYGLKNSIGDPKKWLKLTSLLFFI